MNSVNKSRSVGVDIGGTKTMMVLTDDNGVVLSRRKTPTDRNPDSLTSIIGDFISADGLSMDDLISVGFGVCGITDTGGATVLDAPAVGWYGVDLRGLFGGVKVYADNDVNCCAAGELICGSLRGVSDAVYIAIGTGIGGAVVINGKIYRGHSFCAGEIGLFTCRHDGKDDVEDRVSGSALNRRSTESYGISSRELFQRYARTGEDTGGLIAEFVDEIAAITANCVSLLNPETVIYGGGVAESMPCVMDRLRERVRYYTPIRVKLGLSSLANEAAAIGAAMLYKN